MPDVSVVTPAAVVPADRLTLGATDARAWPRHDLPALPLRVSVWYSCYCMAEE